MTNTNTAIRAVDYHPRWFIRFDVIPSNCFIMHDIHLITLCIDCVSIYIAIINCYYYIVEMVYKLKYHALFTFDLDVNKTDLLQLSGIYIRKQGTYGYISLSYWNLLYQTDMH